MVLVSSLRQMLGPLQIRAEKERKRLQGDDGHAEDDEVHTDLALDDRAAALGVGLQPTENEQGQRQYDENNDDGGQKRLAVDRDIPLRAVQAVKELGGQQQLKAQAVHDIQRFFIHPAQPPHQHADAQHQQDGGHDPDGEQKSLHFLSFPLRPSTSRRVFFPLYHKNLGRTVSDSS